MSNQAPVCHVPPQQTTHQPSPVNLPSIPPAAATVNSLAASVNAMRVVINYITGRQGPQGPRGAAGASGKKSKPARWTEQSRTTEVIKIYNPNDHSQFIEVERINSLTMQDGVTGESWNWSR